MQRIAVLIATCVLAVPASGAEYICKTADGKTLIQSLPCPSSAKTTYTNTRPEESAEETAARNKLRSDRAEVEAQKIEQQNKRRQAAAEESSRRQAALDATSRDYENQRRQEWMMRELQRTRQEAAAARGAAEEAAANSSAQQPRRTTNCVPNGIGGMVCN